MAGILYLCATPIGNMEDITVRAVRVLKEVDLIAAEDTRNSKKLLNRYEISTRMTSYHEHNKYEKGRVLVDKLQEGIDIALISDAGTPGISDPGEELVRLCLEEGIKVTALPGACAGITALTISGLSTRRFVFEGFLPSVKSEKKFFLQELKNEVRTMVFYEAPHRLQRTLAELYEVLGDRKIAVVRELTKRYETIMSTSFQEAIEYYDKHSPKGEYVIVVEGKDKAELQQEEIREWESMSIEEHMDFYMTQGEEKKEAMKLVAKDRGLTKREIYKALIS